MKHLAKLCLALVCASVSYASDLELRPNQRHATEVFGRWFKIQRVYKDVPPASILVDDDFLAALKKHLIKDASALNGYQAYLSFISGGRLSADHRMVDATTAQAIKTTIHRVHEQLEHDPKAFIDDLLHTELRSPLVNEEESTAPSEVLINRHRTALRLLACHPDPILEERRLFSMADRLSRFCFDAATAPHYRALYAQKQYYPVLRFINAAVWQTLVGSGWKHWQADVLDAIKRDVDSGKQLVYVAGGTDLYQFLRVGIYNVVVLDPFFPTQERYYTAGWDYLVSGKGAGRGLGDEIICGAECNNVRLVRRSYHEQDLFYAKLSNNTIWKTPKSITRWDVVSEDGDVLGAYTFVRRPVEQNDLAYDPNKIFLMSYDEVVYIAQPSMLSGWGIDPSKLDERFAMYIKQLRRPIDRTFLENMRVAALLNSSELKYINFASDPT